LATAFVIALIVDAIGGWRGDPAVRSFARTGFATLVLVDVGVLPGLVAFVGGLL
jgi:hypothetical protein